MLSILKTSLDKLESATATAKTDLHKVSAQHEAAVTRAAELADLVASASADAAENADSLEQQHFQAELRVKSLATAVERTKARHANAEQALAEARAKAKAEASAAAVRKLADDLAKSKPAAASAARKVAEIWGTVPVRVQLKLANKYLKQPNV